MSAATQYAEAKAAGYAPIVRQGVVHIKTSSGAWVKWDPLKHPRGPHGQFAHTAGPSAPIVLKGHKPDYMPPSWEKIKGANAKAHGLQLFNMKDAGKFKNDHEMYLAAAKMAAQYKKAHPSVETASANGIYNAALRHEINKYGHHTMLPQLGAAAPKTAPAKPTHAVTPSGVKVVSKFLAPGQLEWTGETLGGVSGARVYKDHTGTKWIVKVPGGWKGTSQAYSNSKFLSDLDVATGRIQNKAGLPVPAIHKIQVEGKTASVQKMYSRAKPIDFNNLSDSDVNELQKNMVLDWLLSNHDAHSGNFLRTDKGIVGIDKGQSFKYFGKDKLTPSFGSDLNPPLAPNKPVYSTMMKNNLAQMTPFNEGNLKTEIDRIQAIPDDEYKNLLRPYAEQAAQAGLLMKSGSQPNNVDAFLQAAVNRKNNLHNDFDKLWGDLHPAKVTPQATPTAVKAEPTAFKVGDKVKLNVANMTNDDLGDWAAEGIHHNSIGTIKYVEDNGNYSVEFPGVEDWAQLKPSEVISSGATAAKAKPAGLTGAAAGAYYNKGALSYEDLKTYVAEGNAKPANIYDWYAEGNISGDEYKELAEIEHGGAAKISPEEFTANVLAQKLAPGHEVVPHPTDSGTFAIKKPGGGFSQSSSGVTKSWPTKEDALNSSTMAKYKAQAEQHATYEKASSKNFANAAPNYTIDQIGSYPQSDLDKYNELKAKISAGEDTGDEYAQFKSLKSKFDNATKAAGAAQVEHGFENESGGFTPPAKPPAPAISSKKLGGMNWKAKGGAPPSWDKIKGPDVKELGAELWKRKQAGEFANVYDMYKAASKISAAQKKRAEKDNPGQDLEAGVHYASANQLRNAALRTEFDETGNVIWETAEEKTSGEIGQTVAEIKHTISLHDHKPVVEASPGQYVAAHAKEFGNKAFDPSAPVGSYTNPHAFKTGDSTNLQNYGYKYTDHKSWPQDQKSAWYNFSGSGSGTLNTFFRTGNVGTFGDPVATKKRAKALIDAFNSPNVKPLDDWTMVVRGTSGGWEFGIGSDAATFDEIKAMEGKVVRNKCPVSSSLRDRPPWGNIRITYKLPPGFRGLNILGKSAHSSENEVILPPGMAYRILEVKKGGANYSSEVLVEVVDVKMPKIDV